MHIILCMCIHVCMCVCACVCIYIHTYVNTCTSNNTVLLKFRTWIFNQDRRRKLEQRCEMAEIKRTLSQKEKWNYIDSA